MPPLKDIDLWIFQAVIQCLDDPDLAETMTGGERRKIASDIRYHCEQLSRVLKPFKYRNGRPGLGWPFQPIFDLLALDVSVEQIKDLDRDPSELEDIQNWRRYGIYGLLMDNMDDVLAAIVEGGEWFAESQTLIKKPNDPNAKRLYFLRMLTRKLCDEFGSPCRAASLALTSVYFDCGDLSEASISKLAPVEKRKPVDIQPDTLKEIIGYMESRIGEVSDPDSVEEIAEGVNFLKGILAKSSG